MRKVLIIVLLAASFLVIILLLTRNKSKLEVDLPPIKAATFDNEKKPFSSQKTNNSSDLGERQEQGRNSSVVRKNDVSQDASRNKDNKHLPLTDNTTQPYTAVYRGSVHGLEKPRGCVLNDAFAAWLNRSVLWALDSTPNQTWDNLTGQAWQLAPWGRWVKEREGRRFVYNVFILPGPWNGSGPTSGWRAGKPVSLEEGAAGTYNEIYRQLAENLVKHGLGNSILRLGVEFNGGWFTWRVENNDKARAFAGYWRQIVNTMRAVSGAEHLSFDWNVNNSWCGFDPEIAWPGNEFVDAVGVDTYDDAYIPGTYPWPKDATPAIIEECRKKAWDEILNGKFGLKFWSTFAARHHKPMSLPEWGLNNKPDRHGGGDNVRYIENMYAFITDPANNILYQSYFDFQAGDGHHQVSPGDNNFKTEFPQAAERFRVLFSLPITKK